MAVNPDKNIVEQSLIARLIGKIKRIALDMGDSVTAETSRARAAEAAAKTEVVQGENCTIDKTTAPDGHDVYTINADGKPQVQADWNQADETKVDYIKNKPNLGLKADKVQGATAGNLAALDANGNLTDSGKKVADFKTKQSAVTDPTADGTGLSFIDSVTQNVNGEITPHKKTVQDGTTSQKGVVRLSNAINSTSTTEAATPKAVKDAYDELNNKIVARATFLSQAEWSTQSQLPGDPAKVYYVEDGTGEDAYTVYVWKASTSEYVEVDESSIDLDGYWHDGPSTTGSGNVVTGITLGNDGVPVLEKGLTALTQHQDISGKLDRAEVGIANGAASLDSNGDVPLEQIPDSVKDKIVYIDGMATLNTSTGVFTLTVPNTTFATISAIVNAGKLPVLRVTVNNGNSYLKLYYKGLISNNANDHWHSFGSTDNFGDSPSTTDAKVYDSNEWRMTESRAVYDKGFSSDTKSTFTKASGDTSSMTSGDKLSAIFTAISSFFASLKALAFKDKASYSDLSSSVQSSLNKADSALQSHQAVSDSNPTLAWGATSTVGTVGSTNLRVTMPANPASGKQDVISDLATIRSGASAGASALQPNGNGSNLSVTPDGTSTGTDIGGSTTLKVWAQKFKNLVGALKALAFKDKVGTSDIADDAITAAKVKDNETLPVNVSGTAGTAAKTFTVRRSLTASNYKALLKITVSGSSTDFSYSGAIFSFTSRSNGTRNINGLIVVNPFEWNSYEIVAKTIILGERSISQNNDIPIFYIRQSVVNNKWYYEIWSFAVTTNTVVTINALNCSMNSIEEISDTSETQPERMTECILYKNVVAKTNTNSANYAMVGSTTTPVYVDADGQMRPCTPSSMSVGNADTVDNLHIVVGSLGSAANTLYFLTGA